MFQFQNGAIKSLFIDAYYDNTDEFQFQNGAIKRSTFDKFILSYLSFNSKMVRLKVKVTPIVCN